MQDLQLLALRRQEALAGQQHRIAEPDTRLALRSAYGVDRQAVARATIPPSW